MFYLHTLFSQIRRFENCIFRHRVAREGGFYTELVSIPVIRNFLMTETDPAFETSYLKNMTMINVQNNCHVRVYLSHSSFNHSNSFRKSKMKYFTFCYVSESSRSLASTKTVLQQQVYFSLYFFVLFLMVCLWLHTSLNIFGVILDKIGAL